MAGGVLATLVAAGGAWWSRDHQLSWLAGALATAYLAFVTLYAATAADLLLALTTTVFALVLAAGFALRQRSRAVETAAALVVPAAAFGGWAVVAWGQVLDLDTGTQALTLAVYAGLVVLAPRLVTSDLPARLALEGTALVLAVVGLGYSQDPAVVAQVLLVLGASVAVLAVTMRDRSLAGWGAALLLAVSTLVRLDLGVREPELWILPVAALLVGMGLLRLRSDRSVPSRRAPSGLSSTLGSGLAVAFVALGAVVAGESPDALSTAVAVLLAVAAVALFAHLERRDDVVVEAAAGGVLAVLSGAGLLQVGGTVAGLGDRPLAVALAVYAGLVAVVASRATRRTASRVAVEVSAGMLALTAAAASPDGSALAWVLTVVGVALGILSVVDRDRSLAGWGATLVLAGATLVRFDLGSREPEIWVLPVAALLVAAGLVRLRADGRSVPTSTLGSGLALTYVALLTLFVGDRFDGLSAGVATAVPLLVAALFVHLERREAPGESLAAAVLAVLGGAVAAYVWSEVADLSLTTLAVGLAVYAGLVAVIASRATRRTPSRLAFEVTAALLGLLAAGLAADDSTLAMVLTLLGSAIALVAVTNHDRSFGGWLGAVVLAGATFLRVVDDVQAPELYTLPAAALLIGAGFWRLRTDPRVSSLNVMGSGLTLALLPSLLLALEEPVSLRGALVGAGGVLVLSLGVQQRLVAPFTLGAITTAVLAVRHLQPYADAVPRWVSLGAVGVGLLVVGITWEARRRNLETAGRYLADLR